MGGRFGKYGDFKRIERLRESRKISIKLNDLVPGIEKSSLKQKSGNFCNQNKGLVPGIKNPSLI